MTIGLALVVAGLALILWALPSRKSSTGTIDGGTAPGSSGATGGSAGAGAGGGGGGSW